MGESSNMPKSAFHASQAARSLNTQSRILEYAPLFHSAPRAQFKVVLSYDDEKSYQAFLIDVGSSPGSALILRKSEKKPSELAALSDLLYQIYRDMAKTMEGVNVGECMKMDRNSGQATSIVDRSGDCVGLKGGAADGQATVFDSEDLCSPTSDDEFTEVEGGGSERAPDTAWV